MIEKTSVPKIIVLNSAVAIPTAGTRLFSTTTGADVLAVNGVGVYEPVAGSSSPKASNATTAATTQYIELIKRRDTSGDKSPLPPRHYERSGLIDLDCLNGLQWSGAAAETPTSHSILVGNVHGAVGAIMPVDNATYTFVVTADDAKSDKIYGKSITPTLNVTRTFGEFGVDAELATLDSTQQARDYLISALVDKHNVMSSNQGDVLSIAVTIATNVSNLGGAVKYNVTELTALTVGSQLVIGYNTNGSPVRMNLTADNKAALLALLAAANTKAGVTTASIVTYAMPSASNAGLGAALAGGQGLNNARIDMFGLIAVDIADAYYSDIYSSKRRITAGFDISSGFDSTLFVQEASQANTGTGYGANIKQWYADTQHYNQYTSSKNYGALHVAYPDDINTAGYYDVYTLNYCNNIISTGGFPATSPLKLIVVIPNFTVGSAANNAFYTGTANPQKAAFQAIMNAFVARAGKPAVTL
jgi:hypothetical protein